MNKGDWWKYPDSFLKLMMNTGETMEVGRDDINSFLLESLVVIGDRLWNPDSAVVLPFPGDYAINISFGAGSASFVITAGRFPLSYGYFSSEYDGYESAWGCVESHYFDLTDKSAMSWSLPRKPESKPFLAVIRCEGDIRCDCDVCNQRQQWKPDALLGHSQAWLGELESAMGFFLVKEGFPKELYEENSQ